MSNTKKLFESFNKYLNEEDKKEFNYIDDVWEYLEKSKDEEELINRIDDIPTKFGNFTYEIHEDGKGATVTNSYIENDDYQEDKIDIDFVIEESEKLDEKINKDNIEINKAIANPNLGKNKDKIKAAGYETKEDYDGKTFLIKNPKTGKSVNPFAYNKEGKLKVDFKGKLDSERPYTGKLNVRDNYAGKGKLIPNKAVVGKDNYGNKIVRADDFDDYSTHTSMMDDKPNYKSISKNIQDYKQAIKDRDESSKYAERSKEGIGYYVDKVKKAQDDLDRENKYIKDKEQQATNAENRRKEIIDKVRAKRKTESEEVLTEKRNPENDKANELIRSALGSTEFAKNHATELRKHGIKYIPPKKGEEWRGGALEGKDGRRLTIPADDYYKNNVDKITDIYNAEYDDSYADNNDLHQKTYTISKERYKTARKNIDKQTKKVANMEKKDKEAGIEWNKKTVEAKSKLNKYKDTLAKGITPNYKETDKIHPDVDLKGFLNAKKHSDRPLARENDPKYKRYGGKVADPANSDVEDYKELKSAKSYLDKEKERVAQDNKEDQDRIEAMKKRAKEDKARREMGLKNQEKEINALDKKVNSRLDAYRKRMSNK